MHGSGGKTLTEVVSLLTLSRRPRLHFTGFICFLIKTCQEKWRVVIKRPTPPSPPSPLQSTRIKLVCIAVNTNKVSNDGWNVGEEQSCDWLIFQPVHFFLYFFHFVVILDVGLDVIDRFFHVQTKHEVTGTNMNHISVGVSQTNKLDKFTFCNSSTRKIIKNKKKLNSKTVNSVLAVASF